MTRIAVSTGHTTGGSRSMTHRNPDLKAMAPTCRPSSTPPGTGPFPASRSPSSSATAMRPTASAAPSTQASPSSLPLLPYTRAGRREADYDAVATLVAGFNVAWVVLAGWIPAERRLRRALPKPCDQPHPALPGTFPGTDAIARAFEAFQRGEIATTGVMDPRAG